MKKQKANDFLLAKKRREERLIELYPNHNSDEISRILGVHKATVFRMARKLNLRKSDEYVNKLKDKSRTILSKYVHGNRDVIEKRTKTWKHRRRVDEFYFLSGMPQKTKFRMKVYPDKLYSAMYKLHQRYGYDFSDDDYTMVRPEPYDKERLTKVENYHRNKYKIKFV